MNKNTKTKLKEILKADCPSFAEVVIALTGVALLFLLWMVIDMLVHG